VLLGLGLALPFLSNLSVAVLMLVLVLVLVLVAFLVAYIETVELGI
jgi:hypothetical protein